MSIQNYKRRNLQNPYTPLYSTISVYGTRYNRPSLFSNRRVMSSSGYSISRQNSPSSNSRVISVSSIGSRDSSQHSLVSISSKSDNDVQIVGENRGVLTDLSTGFLDTGRNVFKKWLSKEPQHDVIDLTTDDDENVRRQNDEELNDSYKRRKYNNDKKLNLSRDPFGWNKWETQAFGTETSPEKQNSKQYGTHFYRNNERRKESISNAPMILRGESDEVSYLRQIFNGTYEIPKIIEDEREEQWRLLERDRQLGKVQNSRIKNSIIDITEKIKKILMESRKQLNEPTAARTGHNDDLIFVREHKLTSLEKKRQDFYNDNFKLDKSLQQFKDEFRNYRQLINKRKQIQEEIRAKREKAKRVQIIIPQLDNADITEVKTTLNRNDNGILSDKDNLEVRVRDIKTLAPRRWLNDTVIEYFMKFIESSTEKTVAFNSFFYTTLSERGYQGVRRWMKRKKVTITDLNKIFVPINLNQSHWALGMIDIQNKTINYVDSLSHGPNAMSFAILNDLKGYVISESKEAIGQDFELNHISCPQQPNGFDCGIYVCLNTLYLSKDTDLTFDYKDAANMRTYIAHLILSGDKA
ncbi:Smt3-specific protease [Maudiozyma exigua]|uniref:Smt3-specific protease n=1 Tax=Maudiozyma exigua TaxID=34358 RepID=A0A9P6WEU7_MAUEX|nr:Smt3-specific protease [Kazachstania exigua]